MCGSRRHRMHGLRLNRSQGMNPRCAEGIAVSIKKCLDCGLLFPNPLPVPELLSDHYGIPSEEYWTSDAHRWDPAYFAEEIATAKRLIDFRGGMAALDIGTGLGKCMKSLTVAGFDAFGIEPSEPFRTRSIEHMKLDPDRVQLAALEEARFAPASFDFITFGAVLEHLYDPSAALKRALEWLRPGGVMQAEVPSSDHFVAKMLNVYYRIRGTNFVTNTSPMHSPFHIYEFTVDSFVRNGRRIGYDVIEHKHMVCAIYHVPKFLHRPLRAWMDKTRTGMQLTVWMRPY